MNTHRLASGGRIDRSRPLRFTFDGRIYSGFAGDMLASALLANGVRIVGRSFKYHRPRGIMGAGVEEANALVEVGEGARAIPNLRATEVELHDGLIARAVNCWPSAVFDIGAVNNLVARFIPAGFYYKTFMWPHWHLYEWAIRKAAGLGKPSAEPDPGHYDHCYAHCDVLVVGAGPAGLAAAKAASASGARVIICEQDFELGGRLLWDDSEIDGQPGAAWAQGAAQFLSDQTETRVLRRTSAVGYFDHNALALVERMATPGAVSRQRLWQVRAKHVVLATGALERPLVFPGNDRPGVMLATAAQQYLRRYGVQVGRRVVVFTNNDSAYATAEAYANTGAASIVVDLRTSPPRSILKKAVAAGVIVHTGSVVIATHGAPMLEAITVERSGARDRIACDLLAASGGFNPTLHLFCQSGGSPRFDAETAMFVPGQSVQAEQSVGAAAGVLDLATAVRQGHAAGESAARAAGFDFDQTVPAAVARAAPQIEPCWRINGAGKAFVDFQNDVTVDDIALAARENFVSVEHLKRYTTLGMAPDQGKTSNVNALAIMADMTGKSIPATGTTRYRFPFTSTAIGAFAGRARGELFKPFRRMPAHDWHEKHGAVFEEYGEWLRPAWYRRATDSAHEAEQREALAVRQRVGVFDGSPLGKIEVVGPDAGAFLDRLYANTMSTLQTGRVRYGLMLNELGVVIDDGVVARLAPDRFLVSTTGAGAHRIASWMEEWRQCEWPELNVLIAPITTAWGVLTLTGPAARAVLADAGTNISLDAAEFPHMHFREGEIGGYAVRVFRVSFTGELSYEINVQARQTTALWRGLMQAGETHGIEPVGVDAWMLLRAEKGYLHVGADTDGSTLPQDVGWERVLKRKDDFIGKRSLSLADAQRRDRLQFVGVETDDAKPLSVGAHLVAAGAHSSISEGYVTSAGFSPTLGRGVALAMVRSGRERMGQRFDVVVEGRRRPARICAPCAYDPAGEQLNA
jgi:sarcosine oxidase, subunit alpha